MLHSRCKTNETGMVLITVLIFLQLVSLLGLYLLQAGLLSYRVGQVYQLHHDLLSSARTTLTHIESQLESQPLYDDVCTIQQITRHDLLLKSMDWWQTYACRGEVNGQRYYYVIEPLPKETCMPSSEDATAWIPVRYVRITLLMFSKNKVFREWLQSTVIKLDNAMRDCAAGDPGITLGSQSWRRL